MKKGTGITITGRLQRSGVTIYDKQGVTVIRSTVSLQPKRCTKKQFDVRERRSYATAVWRYIKGVCGPLFTGDRHPYYLYCALAAKLPVLYLTEFENGCGSAPLMPGIPVSRGTLPDVGCHLTAVEGVPALLTDLRREQVGGDRLLLVTLRQWSDHGTPRLVASAEEVPVAAMDEVAGCLALTGDRFADMSCGWALVRCCDGRRSTQTVVTAADGWCTYTTAAARQRAAASYGGFKY